jgi:hypothetical protein
VAGRYRLPLVPPMLVLAAVGLVRMGEAVRRRGQGVFLVAVPILATAAVALDADVEQVLVLVATLILGASAADRLGISTSRGEPRASLVADVTEGL